MSSLSRVCTKEIGNEEQKWCVSGQNEMSVKEDIDSRVVRKDTPTLVEIDTCSIYYANRISGYSDITAVGRE